MQERVKNDYHKRIEKAVNFIEENLTKKLSVEMIAEKASFSKYHFIRVFKAMTGETVGSYLRRRRISKSARQLIDSKRSILSIALEYQFESQEAYTRSFKQIYRTSPGKYRKLNNNQIAYGRAKLTTERLSHLKNHVTMEPKVITIGKKRLAGLFVKTSLANNNIPKLWSDFMPLIKNIKGDCYEVSPLDPEFKVENFTEDMEFEKWAAVEVEHFDKIPEGLKSITIEGGKYAVFEHKGAMCNVQMSFDYAHGTWLLNSDYRLDQRASFEKYGAQYFGPEHPDSITEIWIPIK